MDAPARLHSFFAARATGPCLKRLDLLQGGRNKGKVMPYSLSTKYPLLPPDKPPIGAKARSNSGLANCCVGQGPFRPYGQATWERKWRCGHFGSGPCTDRMREGRGEAKAQAKKNGRCYRLVTCAQILVNGAHKLGGESSRNNFLDILPSGTLVTYCPLHWSRSSPFSLPLPLLPPPFTPPPERESTRTENTRQAVPPEQCVRVCTCLVRLVGVGVLVALHVAVVRGFGDLDRRDERRSRLLAVAAREVIERIQNELPECGHARVNKKTI